LEQLQKGLAEFDVPTEDNPRNQYFASSLFERFGSRTMAEKKTNAEVKKKTEYSLVDMDLAKGKKIFLGDQ
jgi:hypothetical protein